MDEKVVREIRDSMLRLEGHLEHLSNEVHTHHKILYGTDDGRLGLIDVATSARTVAWILGLGIPSGTALLVALITRLP